METPGVSWIVLVLAAALLGAGLALLTAEPQPSDCDEAGFCPGPALRSGSTALLAWCALGMALLLDILWLGMTQGGTVLGARRSAHRSHR